MWYLTGKVSHLYLKCHTVQEERAVFNLFPSPLKKGLLSTLKNLFSKFEELRDVCRNWRRWWWSRPDKNRVSFRNIILPLPHFVEHTCLHEPLGGTGGEQRTRDSPVRVLFISDASPGGQCIPESIAPSGKIFSNITITINELNSMGTTKRTHEDEGHCPT